MSEAFERTNSDEDIASERIIYTPDTGRVRAAYVHGVGGSTWYEGKAEMLRQQFDRWLFEMQEDAWDRGYQAGVVDFAAEGTNNPYREGENSE